MQGPYLVQSIDLIKCYSEVQWKGVQGRSSIHKALVGATCLYFHHSVRRISDAQL